MRANDHKYFEHPLVQQMFSHNEQFYRCVYENNYPIERLIGRPNRRKEDVVKILAFDILGDREKVARLLNIYHFGWRHAF